MVSAEAITDRDSFSVRPPHHAKTRRSALLYSRKLASLLVAFAFVLSYAPPSSAATITVDSTCSLPNAIISANTDTAVDGCDQGSGRDTIRLSGTINLDANLPAITAPLDIRGPSSGYATIDGQGAYQIFRINDGVNPTLSNLRLQNANKVSNVQFDGGAALVITGGGRLSAMHFNNNSVSGPNVLGAAIVHSAGTGTLYISDSVFTDNSAYHAGAMWSTGDGVGERLIFEDNQAVSDGGAIDINPGGGASNEWTFTDVTFAGNVAGVIGGALELSTNGLTTITINDAIFRNNSAPTGGAIYFGSTGTLTVNDSTFDGNVSTSNGSVLGMSNGIANFNRVRFRNNSGGTDLVNAGAGTITINCLLELSGNSPNVIDPAVTITNNNCPSESGSRSEPAPDPKPAPDPEPARDHAEEGREHRRELFEGSGIEVDSAQDQVFGNHLMTTDGHPDYTAIGDAKLTNLGVKDAADVFGWVDEWNPAEICFPGTGLLMIRDGRDSPRTLRGLETYYVDGKTCATLTFFGTVALLPDTEKHRECWEAQGGRLIQLQTQTVSVAVVPRSGSGDAPTLDCDLGAQLQAGDWAFRDGRNYSNLRSSPFVGDNDIGNIQSGELVQVLSDAQRGITYRWYQVRTSDGQDGWVAESGPLPLLGECAYYFRPAVCTLDSLFSEGDLAVVVSDTPVMTIGWTSGADEQEATTLPVGSKWPVKSVYTINEGKPGTYQQLRLVEPETNTEHIVQASGINDRGECVHFLTPPDWTAPAIAVVPEPTTDFVPELDPNIEKSIVLGKSSQEWCLAEGKEFHRVQLLLTAPTNAVSVRMTVSAPNNGNMVPGLTLWPYSGDPKGRDPNDGELNVAQLDLVDLGTGLYIISAWTVRGSGCYTLEVVEGGLTAVEAQAVPTPQTVPLLSQEDIENLPRLETETVNTTKLEKLQELDRLYGLLETTCSAATLKPEASVREAILGGVKAGIDEGVLTQELIVDYLGPELTPEQAEAVVKINIASEIPGASPCSFLSIAIKEYQNNVEGLPPMWQFYGPLYLALGIDPRGEVAEKLLDPVPSCVMKSSQAVAGRAWPHADRAEVGRIRQGDNLQVYGKIKLPGQEEFYIMRGQVQSDQAGLMYIAASQVDVVGNCDDVVDLSPLADKLDRPLNDDEELGPLIIKLKEKDCPAFKIDNKQTITLCDEYGTTDCDADLINAGCSINCVNSYRFTKITVDGWAYMEGPSDGLHKGWVPVIQNATKSNPDLLNKVAFGRVNYPKASQCVAKYYEE